MDRNQKVLLLIESDCADAHAIMLMLHEEKHQHNITVDVATSLADGLEKVDDSDVAIINLSLSDSMGIKTFNTLRNHATVPVIVLTKETDEALGLQAVKTGAQDYLVIGQFSGKTLTRSVLYAIERHRREIAENRLSSVLDALSAIRSEMNALRDEVQGCSSTISDINDLHRSHAC